VFDGRLYRRRRDVNPRFYPVMKSAGNRSPADRSRDATRTFIHALPMDYRAKLEEQICELENRLTDTQRYINELGRAPPSARKKQLLDGAARLAREQLSDIEVLRLACSMLPRDRSG
jgi:hypothetical protein